MCKVEDRLMRISLLAARNRHTPSITGLNVLSLKVVRFTRMRPWKGRLQTIYLGENVTMFNVLSPFPESCRQHTRHMYTYPYVRHVVYDAPGLVSSGGSAQAGGRVDDVGGHYAT